MSDNRIFKGVEDAKPSFAANYEREGHYFMFIRQIKRGQTRPPKRIDFVAIEKICVGVLNTDNVSNPHKLGESLTHWLGADKDMFLNNVKAIIANVFGYPADDVEEDDCEAVCGEDQPMSCRIVENENRVITLKNGNPFTLINYKRTLMPDEIQEIIPPEILEKYLKKEEVDLLLNEERYILDSGNQE